MRIPRGQVGGSAAARRVGAGLAAAVASCLAVAATAAETDFWAFRPLSPPAPAAAATSEARGPIDALLLEALERRGLGFSPPADRRTLARRLTLDLTGLPPSAEDVDAFVGDAAPDAFERLADRLLASPRSGERWAQAWLDAAGYADSNGYHRNDTPRPLAYRYRDHVIRCLREDQPYDRFIVEQLAGDELVGPPGERELSPDEVGALTATHFLRNAPDGTDSTEGNEMVRTMERYAVLEQELQIIGAALFGLTLDCARCHDHKFDPIPQRDYYALQAVFYPAFNVKSWASTKDRWIHAASTREVGAWQESERRHAAAATELRRTFETWVADRAVPGAELLADDFATPELAAAWAGTGAAPPRLDALDGAGAAAAGVDGGKLVLVAASSDADARLVTKRSFDWTPERIGGWIQAEFDLIADSVAGSKPAARIGWHLAARTAEDAAPGGNLLIDGNRAGGADVHLHYGLPGVRKLGKIGTSRYLPGARLGVRLTRTGEDEYLLAQVADGRLEARPLTLRGADLADGALGFQLCCGRSFAVDRVAVSASLDAAAEALAPELQARRAALEAALRDAEARRLPEPPRISWVTDLSPEPPAVPLLRRGDYFQPGDAVAPAGLSALSEPGQELQTPGPDGRTTGRRLAFALWATRTGSRASALLARVEANRTWLAHFGRGLVETPENFGASGSRSTNPALLEHLASELVSNGWSRRRLHRQIVLSSAYRQASAVGSQAAGARVDAEDRLLWRFPPRRLDAESLRDALLCVAGVLDLEMGGPPVDFEARDDGEVVAAPSAAGAPAGERRSIYLRQRRSQPLTFLAAFDKAAMDPSCAARASSTVVSQSLAMLNGELAVRTASRLAARLRREAPGGPREQVERACRLALGRPPSPGEAAAIAAFIERQASAYAAEGVDPATGAAAARGLEDACRMLLATDEFAYLE